MNARTSTEIAVWSTLLAAMANAQRIRILARLLEGEMSVNDLTLMLGTSQSNVSQHLTVLKEARLVNTRRMGQTVFYFCDNPAVAQIFEAIVESTGWTDAPKSEARPDFC
jgi:ArsR family transcriptional regulator, virulence genes transcriptional regulator